MEKSESKIFDEEDEIFKKDVDLAFLFLFYWFWNYFFQEKAKERCKESKKILVKDWYNMCFV